MAILFDNFESSWVVLNLEMDWIRWKRKKLFRESVQMQTVYIKYHNKNKQDFVQFSKTFSNV